METETQQTPRVFLFAMAALMLIMGAVLAGVFIFKLQPPYQAGGSCPSGVACVDMPNNAAVISFSPNNATVYLGVNNTVQWTNKDSVQHTVVVCPAGGAQVCSPSVAIASSSILSPGQSFTITLNATGVYHYYCSIHPATMRATIVVMRSGSNASTT